MHRLFDVLHFDVFERVGTDSLPTTQDHPLYPLLGKAAGKYHHHCIASLGDVSSSHVRAMSVPDLESSGLLHNAVLDYIKTHRLYQFTEDSDSVA